MRNAGRNHGRTIGTWAIWKVRPKCSLLKLLLYSLWLLAELAPPLPPKMPRYPALPDAFQRFVLWLVCAWLS